MSKKPIAIGVTDTHATSSNLELQRDIWCQLIQESKSRGINKIYHFGDWVTARKSQSLEVLEHLFWIKEVCDVNGMELIGISGNHDKTDQESIFAYPNIYNDIDKFHIVEETYEDMVDENISVWFMSYFLETGTAKDKLEYIKSRLDKNRINILICHQAINGGLAHENATTNKEIPSDAFIGFDKVLVGHFHNRNKVDCDDVDIWYVGSAFASNYGEDNEKGFTIIYDDGSIEFVNSEFPKYETISVEVDKVDRAWIQTTKEHIEKTQNNVRVIVEGDESELKKVNAKDLSDIGVKKLIKNNISVSLNVNSEGKVEFINLDKKTVKKEYKKFCINQEIDSELGMEFLSF